MAALEAQQREIISEYLLLWLLLEGPDNSQNPAEENALSNGLSELRERPLEFTDPTGLDKQYFNREGQLEQTVKTTKQDEVFVRDTRYNGSNLQTTDTQLKDTNGKSYTTEQFKNLQDMLYSEMNPGNKGNPDWHEAAAMYDVLKNRAAPNNDNSSAYTEAPKASSAWRSRDIVPAFDARTNSNVYKTKMATATQGLIQGITSNHDYSNGAVYWDGFDITFNAHSKWGLTYSQQSHNLYSAHNTTNTGLNPYIPSGVTTTLQTTAAYGGTVFSQYTDQYLNAMGWEKTGRTW